MSFPALLSNNQLKVIAMVSMLIDHIGMILFPRVLLFRILGRLAMPLFAYMIAEGCRYTRNRPRYLLMLASFAALCQVAYAVSNSSLYQNILVTFSMAVAVIFSVDRCLAAHRPTSALAAVLVCGGVLFVTLGLPALIDGFRVDYGLFGVCLPVAVYYAPTKPLRLAATGIILTALALSSKTIQWFALFALPLLLLYNGQRGRYNLKYWFYLFYPFHLLCLQVIDTVL